MKKIFTIIMIMAMAMIIANGCGMDKSNGMKSSSSRSMMEKPMKLCAMCGEFKGSAKCCKPGAMICAKCGLHKGSPGCCK